MQITIDVDLQDDEIAQLGEILGCSDCPEDQLAVKLRPYAEAAFKEYALMFLGQRVFQRGDYREFRLLLLIQKAFNNRMPEEGIVSTLFQTTPSQSRALIRSVMSRYQYQTKKAVDAVYIDVLQRCEKINAEEDSDFCVTITSPYLVDGINRIILTKRADLPRLMRRVGTSGVYTVAADTYNWLCQEFGINK